MSLVNECHVRSPTGTPMDSRAVESSRNIPFVFLVTAPLDASGVASCKFRADGLVALTHSAAIQQRPAGCRSRYILRDDVGRRIISCISNARPRSVRAHRKSDTGFHRAARVARAGRLDTNDHFVFGARNALLVLGHVYFRIRFIFIRVFRCAERPPIVLRPAERKT